jgi:hypothetical protein
MSWPSAVTTSADTRLSQVRPYLRSSQPIPPPRVKPAMPVLDTRPPVTAKPNAWVSWSSSDQVTPGWATARRPAGSTRIPFIGEVSMTTPPSQVENPAMLWAPPRTASWSPWLRANSTARTTSAEPVQRMISAGRRSCAAFQTPRACS